MKKIQVYGPYFSNYSYARVNRGLAFGLDKVQDEYKISLYCDPEKIDYQPTEVELKSKPELKKLVDNKSLEPNVVIYNNFPKTLDSSHGLKDLAGLIKIMYIAWEESVYPSQWVDEINENLHGVMAATSFVRGILRDSGVKVPITVVPNAMDDKMKLPPQKQYPIETDKSFKFLHISTAKKRKGVDVLLKAYFEEFTSKDDVTLIIKSFPGPDNTVDQLLNELSTENSPEVIHINNPDLTEEELTSLIQQSDCGVYPSRAEGFGLPILESMYNEVPIIATNYSGYLDFCDEDSAYMIDYKLEYASDSEFANIGAKWAEPDQEHLQKLMRELYEIEIGDQISEERDQKILIAKERAEKITWDNSAKLALDFIKSLEKTVELKNKNAAVISFVNDETGIADYTFDLYSKIENSFKSFYYFGNIDLADRQRKDDLNVLRLWHTGEKDFNLLKSWLDKNPIDLIHIQYHSGAMFSPESLCGLIQELKNRNIEVYVTLHAVRGDNFDFIKECKELKLADKVFIHNKKDFEYASQTLKNAELFIHPILQLKRSNKNRVREKLGISENYPVIATHGLMNRNKGIDRIIKAVKILKEKHPSIFFISLSAISSNNIFAQGIYDQIKDLIKQENLEENTAIITDFLDDEVINLVLQATDVNLFVYSDAGESASGAVRKGINSLNPAIVTDITQFTEFEDEVMKIEDNRPETIADAVDKLLKDSELREKMKMSARDFVQKNNYETKSLALLLEYV